MSTPEAAAPGGPQQGSGRAGSPGAGAPRAPRTAAVNPRPTAARAARVEVQPKAPARPAPDPKPATTPDAAAGRRPVQAPSAPTAPATPQPAADVVGSGTPPERPLASARVRRARLVLSRVDPWSVMKLSFVLSIAMGIIFLTAVAVLWSVLDGMGIFSSLGRTAGELTQGESGGGVDLNTILGLGRVLRLATVLAAVNVVLLTALSTLGAFLYNLASSLVGGLHLTLSEES